MSDAPVIIRQYGDAYSAHAARALLEAHDIPSLVIGDDAGGMQPALTYVRGIRLAVREEDARRALELLDAVVELPDDAFDDASPDESPDGAPDDGEPRDPAPR